MTTITINQDVKCPKCGKPGASEGSDGAAGLCLKCMTEAVIRKAGRATTQGRHTSEWSRNTAAEALLPALRRHHPHLENARLVVLSGPLGHAEGCKTLGRARRPKATERALLEALGAEPPAYVIEVDAEQWAIADMEQKQALLDHELCHMAGREIGEDGAMGDWKLRGHDLEEFLPVLQRHGPWRPMLRDFCKVARQLDLPGLS